MGGGERGSPAFSHREQGGPEPIYSERRVGQRAWSRAFRYARNRERISGNIE